MLSSGARISTLNNEYPRLGMKIAYITQHRIEQITTQHNTVWHNKMWNVSRFFRTKLHHTPSIGKRHIWYNFWQTTSSDITMPWYVLITWISFKISSEGAQYFSLWSAPFDLSQFNELMWRLDVTSLLSENTPGQSYVKTNVIDSTNTSFYGGFKAPLGKLFKNVSRLINPLYPSEARLL